MTGSQDFSILQHGSGKRLRVGVVLIGHKDIHMGAGHEEARDADHLIGAKRDSAHTAGNSSREANARTGSGELTVENRLARRQRIEDRAADNVIDLHEAAIQRMGFGPVDHGEILAAESLARIEGSSSGNILVR
jgi:hypothetical protein